MVDYPVVIDVGKCLVKEAYSFGNVLIQITQQGKKNTTIKEWYGNGSDIEGSAYSDKNSNSKAKTPFKKGE